MKVVSVKWEEIYELTAHKVILTKVSIKIITHIAS